MTAILLWKMQPFIKPAANQNSVVSPPSSNPAAILEGSQEFDVGSYSPIPKITLRYSEDHILLDALNYYLIDVPLDEMINEIKTIIDIETVLNVLMVFITTFYPLFQYQALNFKDRFTRHTSKYIPHDMINS